MIKKRLRLMDGLVHLAIVLSLLRTDIDSYYDHGFYDYPEVQEVIMGSSVGMIQTRFRNGNHRPLVRPAPRHKGLDTGPGYLTNAIIDELLAVPEREPIAIDRTIVSAWLVNEPHQSDRAATDGNNNDDGNNNSDVTDETTGILVDPSDATGTLTEEQSLRGETLVQHSTGAQGIADLTTEEMDLIELLWRQDMDMGVPREMFDPVQRLRLEKQAELDLQNKRAKEKELELLQLKIEEEERQALNVEVDDIWSNTNYTVDGETGEFVALSVENRSDLAVVTADNVINDFNVEAAVQLLAQQNTSALQALIQSDGETQGSLERRMSEIVTATANTSCNESTTPQSTPPNSAPYDRQVSLEQRWQDVANLLEITASSTENTPVTAPVVSPLLDTLILSPVPVATVAEQPAVRGLLQNASFAPTTLTSLLTDLEPVPDRNTVSPSTSSDDASFDLETHDLLFPNITPTANNGRAFNNQLGSFLDDLLEDDDVTLTGISGMHVDDTSSDSAVSSMGSSSPNQDWHDGMSNGTHSPYDTIEGATGSDYSVTAYKQTKFDYFDNDPSYSDQNYNPGNYGGMHNASLNGSDYDYSPAKMRNVNHNHTYTVEPGMTPRESKRQQQEREKQARNSLSRDEKRSKSLKIPFSILEIIETPVEDFNELMQKYPLNDGQLQLIRDIRRRGKNKVAAQNCRKRKLDIIVNLDDEIIQLRKEKDRLRKERHLVDKEANEFKNRFSLLYQEVFQSLRDDNGRPYNPHEYSLQQTADGNVFLVPRNGSAPNDHRDKKHRKRKPNDS